MNSEPLYYVKMISVASLDIFLINQLPNTNKFIDTKKIKGQTLEQNSTKEGQLCMQACPGGHGGISQSTELS
jgi:hypothetical protein